ncbi:MAG: hypothetical protein WC670_09685 [Pseudolabrys sp.]|jgi:hypothetical protein
MQNIRMPVWSASAHPVPPQPVTHAPVQPVSPTSFSTEGRRHDNVITRRGLVAALAVAGAAAAGLTSGADPTPIAKLMCERARALADRERAYAIENAAVAELTEATPQRPAELELTGLDLYHLAIPAEIMPRLETDWTVDKYLVDVETLKAWAATPSWLAHARPDAVERVRRLLGIAERHDAERLAALTSTSREGAGKASDAAHARVAYIEDLIIASPAACVADLAAKAALLQRQQVDEGEPDAEDVGKVLADVIDLGNPRSARS